MSHVIKHYKKREVYNKVLFLQRQYNLLMIVLSFLFNNRASFLWLNLLVHHIFICYNNYL